MSAVGRGDGAATTVARPAEAEAEAVAGVRTLAGTTSVPPPRGSRVLRLSAWAVAALLVASWAFVLSEENAGVGELLSAETLANAGRFLGRLAGADEDEPAFLNAARWAEAGRLAWQTLAMSVLAIGFAAVGTLLTTMAGARPVEGRRGWGGRLLFAAVRLSWVFARAVPELVWALLIVFVLAPGILAGALALGLHTFGVLAKLGAEVVEGLDRRPLRAVRAAGASRAQALLYAVLPSALPSFLTFLLYRWEVIIRTTIVVGFVGAAGLGREFRLRMSYLHYTDVALLLLVYVGLVLAVDAVGVGLRRLAR